MISLLCGIVLSIAVKADAQTVPQGHAAVFWSGKMMLNVCKQSDALLPNEDCRAFAMGVVDLLSEATAAVGGVGSYLVCLTDEVTANQVRDVVVKFLQEHPAELNYSAAYLASRAVAAAWPCPPQIS